MDMIIKRKAQLTPQEDARVLELCEKLVPMIHCLGRSVDHVPESNTILRRVDLNREIVDNSKELLKLLGVQHHAW